MAEIRTLYDIIQDTVVNPKTEEEANEILNFMYDYAGWTKWCVGDELLTNNCFQWYKDKTYYHFIYSKNDEYFGFGSSKFVVYGNIDYPPADGYKIVSVQEFINLIKK